MRSLTFTSLGTEIPAIGFGTFQIPAADTSSMVSEALKIGYRHIDTAQIYGNEAEVGQALYNSGIARDEIFLTTKVWVEYFQHDALIASTRESLRKLKTDYVDLLLLHWPNPNVPLAETIAALNEVQALGLARQIGTSNFNVTLMQQAIALSKSPLFTNQVEYHPYLNQNSILQFAKENDIIITAYCPLARGKVVTDPMLIALATQHNKSPSQIALRWLFQQGVVAIPKTLNPERAALNLNIFDFTLSPLEMAKIHALASPQGRLINPHGLAPLWDDKQSQ